MLAYSLASPASTFEKLKVGEIGVETIPSVVYIYRGRGFLLKLVYGPGLICCASLFFLLCKDCLVSTY